MPYDADIQIQECYIRVEVSGHRTHDRMVEDDIDVWSKVADFCRKKEIFRILAISKLTGRLSTMSIYSLAKSPELLGWSRQFKCAYVELNEALREDDRFAETVAVNRGYNIKIFDTENDAKEWLLETYTPNFKNNSNSS